MRHEKDKTKNVCLITLYKARQLHSIAIVCSMYIYKPYIHPTNKKENTKKLPPGTDLKRKEFENKDESAKKYKKELNTDLEADEGKRSRDKEING